jgi:hypothetical protein
MSAEPEPKRPRLNGNAPSHADDPPWASNHVTGDDDLPMTPNVSEAEAGSRSARRKPRDRFYETPFRPDRYRKIL